MRYSCFKNPEIELCKSISNHTKLKIYKSSFVYWIYIFAPKIKLIQQFLLEICLTREFCNVIGQVHRQIKILKSVFIIIQLISVYKKSSWLNQLLLKYSWLKNPDIWLVDTIFNYIWLKIQKLSPRILESISVWMTGSGEFSGTFWKEEQKPLKIFKRVKKGHDTQ